MSRLHWLCILSALCLFSSGCNKHQAKKPDPTKGTVTGIVLCADTGKPARFATVNLTPVPKADEKSDDGDPLPAQESTMTDLDGRFRMEAVEPGHYFAFAILEGYLDPALDLDAAKIRSLPNDRERRLYAIDQWKEHLTEVAVHVHRSTEVTIQVERAAEIGGTVSFDDGSPAIGMHFQLFQKAEKGGWTNVGLPLFDTWSIHTVSDGHGRYNVTNLSAGEYVVCALMPSDKEDDAARICLGNVFRHKDAATMKVHPGEIASGVDIVIPLNGLHTVAGIVSALADGHPLSQGAVHLLFADDKEKARALSLEPDGSFAFEYVPEGKYILRISGAKDEEQKDPAASPSDADSASKPKPVVYADKEVPLTVLDNMDDIQVQLAPPPADKPRGQ